jgi:2'-5' RNA ligase
MRIAITLSFDPQTAASIRLIWQQLAQQNIAVPGVTSGYHPHITFAVYDTDDIEFYHQKLLPFVTSLRSFPIRLDVLGIFPERGILFLAPRMSRALMNMHQAAVDAFGDNPIAAHLLPDRWTPHCTLAIPASPQQMTDGVLWCQTHWQPFDAEATGIGIQVIPESEDRWYAKFQNRSPGES